MKRRMHRWLGLFLALPLLWLAGTGLALEIATAWRDSHDPRPPASNARDSESTTSLLRRSLESVNRHGRLGDLRSLSLNGSARASFTNGEIWFLDPVNGEILARREAGDFEWVRVLTRLHRGKIFGSQGRYLFSGFGLGCALLVASGLVLIRKARGRRGISDWHMVLGKYTFVPLLLILVTGSIWNISEELRSLRPASVRERPDDWNHALEAASAANAGESPTGLYRVEGRFLATFADATRVYVDGAYEVDIHRPFTWRGWFEPFFTIHSGDYPFGLVITVVAGLGAVGIVATGVTLQFRRSRPR